MDKLLNSFRKTLLIFLSFVFCIAPFNFGPMAAASSDEQVATYLVDENFSFMRNNAPSAWDMEMPGSTFNYSYCTNGRIVDNSSVYPARMTRSFLRQSAGEITLEFRFRMPRKMDGVSWQISDGGLPAIKVLTSGGSLCYENQSGAAVSLRTYSANQSYGVKVIMNLDTQKANYYFNGQLLASGVSFKNLVSAIDTITIETGAAATGDVYVEPVKIYKGFVVNEKLASAATGTTQSDWESTTAGGSADVQSWVCSTRPDVYSFRLNDTSSSNSVSLKRNFPPQTGRLVLEHKFLMQTAADGMQWEYKNGSETAIKILTSAGYICYENAAGTPVQIVSYIPNIWYSVRIVADTQAQKADIYVNGRIEVRGAPFAGAVQSISSFSAQTPAASRVVSWLDDIVIYKEQPTPADYVPEPERLDNSDELVGVQVCSMWREGHHIGWDLISAYPERVPYLGKYDEGSPEVADWEIKWLIEHGVDFQLYCWYRPTGGNNNPIKDPYLGSALHDGLFYAKYSDRMKYAIMWENHSTSSSAANSADFRNNIVPFWIEYYFKDPRYLKIDNKPVISVFQLSGLVRDFGSIEGARAEMDFLRQACINAGFDGAYTIVSNGSSDPNSLRNTVAAGFDSVYNYSWGYNAYNTALQKNYMTAQRNAGIIDVIPSPGMGRDDTAWEGPSGGWATLEDFKDLLSWTKDSFMPTLPENGIGRKMLLIANWNEYGEGHYMMPTPLEGFGYLDAIRSVFGDAAEHIDEKPTEAQKKRINILSLPDRYIEIPGKNMLAASGFENSVTEAKGRGASLSLDRALAHEGLKSLKVTKTGAYGAAHFQLPIQNNRTYSYSAWARLPAGANQDRVLNACLSYNLGGAEKQTTMSSAPLSADEWVNISGHYTVSEDGEISSPSLCFYADGAAAGESFYLDDIEFTLVDNLIPDPGFESNTLYPSNWEAPVSISTTQRRSGSQSLKVDKTHAYGSIKYPVKMKKGVSYSLSAWAKLAPGATAGQKLQMCVTYKVGGDEKSLVMFTGPQLNSSGWTRTSGKYTISETDDITDVAIYMFTDAPAVSETFYIDDISLVETCNIINNGGFEGAAPRLSARGADISLSAEAFRGSASLKVNKTSPDGAAYFSVPLKNQRTYDLTVYAKLPGGATPGQSLKIGVEYYHEGNKYNETLLPSAAIGAGEWTKISSFFIIDRPFDLSETAIWIMTDSPAVSEPFYLDDLSIGHPEGELIDISLNSASLGLMPGQSFRLLPKTQPLNYPQPNFIWESSNPTVAFVSQSGLVTALAEGTAVITVRASDFPHSAACYVTVLSSNLMENPSFEEDSLSNVGSWNASFDRSTDYAREGSYSLKLTAGQPPQFPTVKFTPRVRNLQKYGYSIWYLTDSSHPYSDNRLFLTVDYKDANGVPQPTLGVAQSEKFKRDGNWYEFAGAITLPIENPTDVVFNLIDNGYGGVSNAMPGVVYFDNVSFLILDEGEEPADYTFLDFGFFTDGVNLPALEENISVKAVVHSLKNNSKADNGSGVLLLTALFEGERLIKTALTAQPLASGESCPLLECEIGIGALGEGEYTLKAFLWEGAGSIAPIETIQISK